MRVNSALQVMIAFLAVTGPAAASEMVERGRALAEQICSRCHATGVAGSSTHPDAPEFRTLSMRYPVDALSEALAEGIVTGHPDMPEIRLEPDDTGAMIDYLISIQDR